MERKELEKEHAKSKFQIKENYKGQENYLMVKEAFHQEDSDYNRESKYVNQKLITLKGKIDRCTTTLKGFNSPLSTIDRTTRQKINNDSTILSSNRTQHQQTTHSLHLNKIYQDI